MNHKIPLLVIPLLAMALLISACAPQEAATPAVVEVVEPTDLPPVAISLEAPVITPENASRLAEADVMDSEPATRLVWMQDSENFWVIENQFARPMNVLTLEKGPVAGVNEGGRVLDASPDGSRWAYDPDGTSSVILIDPNDTDIDITIYPNQTIGDGRFTPDGKYLLTYSMDQWQVTLWDAFSGEKVEDFEGFETAAPIYAVFPGSDGKTLIWLARGTLQLQEMESGQMGGTFSHEDFITAFALSPAGDILATAAAGTINGNFTPAVYWWDAVSGEKMAELGLTDPISALAFSPGGGLLAVASGTAVVILDGDQHVVATIPAHADSVNALAFSPDGRTLLTAGSEGLVKIWQVPAG